MCNLSKLAKDKINNYDFNDKTYVLSDKILYKMTNDYYSNRDVNIIVSKLMIIGKTYSAALERVKDKGKIVNYYDVAAAISNSNIEDNIEKLKKCWKLDDNTMVEVLKLHKKLTDIFENYTGLEKRSLASKYLHFHLPNIVFIYDSRVSSVIGEFVNGRCDYKKKIENTGTSLDDIDGEYANFCYKAYEIYKAISNKSKFSEEPTPRYIDRILIRYCDSIGK